MARLIIHNFGPIRFCEIEEKHFTVLTGAQASGKSTVAKVLFFFARWEMMLLNRFSKNLMKRYIIQALKMI